MKNRAKCKLCHEIIESFHSSDYVMCKCGEISLDGGEALRCSAKNWSNFLRIDDEGKEVLVIVKDTNVKRLDMEKHTPAKLSKEELISFLDEMVANIESLPQHAMSVPITHYDFVSLLMLLSSILRAD